MHRPALSVVVPCYNEAACLDLLHARISSAAQSAVGGDYEIVLINDGSRDDSWSVMQRLAAAGGVENLQHKPVLLEDAGLLPEMGNRRVPAAALADGDFELVLGQCLIERRCGEQKHRRHPSETNERLHANPRSHSARPAFAGF